MRCIGRCGVPDSEIRGWSSGSSTKLFTSVMTIIDTFVAHDDKAKPS